MSTLKIVFQAGSKQVVLYGQGMKQMWQVETHVLERLGKEASLKLDTAQFRKYWMDEEGDRVEILNDADFEFFLKRVGPHRTAKIYFEAQYPVTGETPKLAEEQPQSSTDSPRRETENLYTHRTVECDVCKTQSIRGFRYKCLECNNFDLCMKCESEMKHPLHLMIRIPNSESGTWESVHPFANICAKKRHQKKHAAAVAAATAAAGNGVFCSEALQGDGKSRHNRHHRRHCSAGPTGPGIWTHFYDMMQDLAEGGGAQMDSAATETAPQEQQEAAARVVQQQQETAARAAQLQQEVAPQPGPSGQQAPTTEAPIVNSQSKETNTSPDRSSTSSAPGPQTPGGTTAPPSFENLQNFIDPQFMKAGIQILNNFSEMFGKILDPVVVADVTSRTNSEPESVVIDIDLTSGSSHASATTPPPTPKEAADTQETTSAVGSGIITPMETEVSPPTPPATAAESQPHSRNSQGEENDWTMIDNNPTTTNAEASSNAAAAAAVVAATAPPLDFAKLSQQLQSHIENEMKGLEQTTTVPNAMPTFNIPVITSAPVAPAAVAFTPVASAPVTPAPVAPTPVPTPRTPEVTERRAVAVFHPDPRINNAVHAMTVMGFSNEGAALTQLLESVNGNIPLALDLMSAAQR